MRAPLLWELLDSCPDIRCSGSESDLAADREKRAKRVRRLIEHGSRWATKHWNIFMKSVVSDRAICICVRTLSGKSDAMT